MAIPAVGSNTVDALTQGMAGMHVSLGPTAVKDMLAPMYLSTWCCKQFLPGSLSLDLRIYSADLLLLSLNGNRFADFLTQLQR